ncbi:MAG: citrate lyase holo-[acyl-carrier protein] synthase [Sedimenticola sp.]
MSYARLQTEILEARDARESALHSAVDTAQGSVVFASLSIPGEDKTLAGVAGLFAWMLSRIEKMPWKVHWHAPVTCDALGPYCIFSTMMSLETVKSACVEIEESAPAARLIDLDVYGPGACRIGRAEMGLPSRRCLLCDDSATDCIRLHRHDQESLKRHVSLLLEDFTDS